MDQDPQSSVQQFHWQPNKKLLVLMFFLFPLLIFLGFWQLDRADEKSAIVAAFSANQQAAPADVKALLAGGNQQYRSAWLTGALDSSRQIVLDNRVKNGRPGYEILEPMSVKGLEADGLPQAMLVNRGWVPASLDRSQLPEVEPVVGEVQVRGFLYHNLRGGYRLDDQITVVRQWPSRVGWISVERAEELFGEPFYEYQLRLDSDSVGSLETGWVTVAVQPEKHTAYAVQWFVMAAVLLVMTLIANSNVGSWIKQFRRP
ncbi:MAG: SURF1 family protein [Porticoccaceae bacterium]|jgi:surfeit locus 1 family protein|nr:SURF1 family protein [Porticoccaceae bacterium]MBT4592259.1 SURF1 family protein [Porticoccaceae bacterium]MBT6692711.1 SURF1 family protein [Porticoccaceae bacterium]MBT7167893.1 SURF1 family protein [Porticoccaceae bacterium]MBT7567174.1 SURF1 family protein [Porticoccaceae bacterium]